MAATTTALAAYKAGQRSLTKNRTHRKAGRRIPLGIVAGFAPLGMAVGSSLASGNFHMAGWYMADRLTGYDIDQRLWNPRAMIAGWTPIIIGIGAHKLASKFGLNRAIRKIIPWVEI